MLLFRLFSVPIRRQLMWGLVGLAVLATFGCRNEEKVEKQAVRPSVSAERPKTAPSAAPSGSAAEAPQAAERTSCPDPMIPIPGGTAWIGSREGQGAKDEHPRFRTRLAPFCLDETEVTVAAYRRCVEAGSCKPPRSQRVTCTSTGDKRPDHPINCVTWHQANDYCTWRGARLPTEPEWEYAASGGDDRTYSWGNDPPDDRTCWKEPGACKVKGYAPGAFGLYDMTGNLWEWTDDGYGDYPWPPVSSPHKVYRGGSWSRRFEKWMRVRLRNRWSPKQEGSHLGFRCAKTLPDVDCPFGRTDDGERCRHGVLEAECATKLEWNGVRCAPPGAPDCPAAYEEKPGHGCVLAVAPEGKAETAELDLSAVRRTRSPEFDADCATYQPTRPHGYRLEGGSHVARNVVGRKAGCKNRDVGVGWNSACCPL